MTAAANNATLETTQDVQSSEMTAQATVAKSPTVAALERLSKIDPAPDFGHGNELQPWLAAAAVAGFELPAAIIDVVQVGAHLAEEQAANVHPPKHRAGDVDAILLGATVDEVLNRDAAHDAAVARWEDRNRLLMAGTRLLQGEVSAAFVPQRDSLIRNELRHAVADLLEQAAKVAKQLRKFAPDFSEATLLAKGSPAELTAWRASRELQKNLQTLLTAWRWSWYAATGRGKSVGLEFLPERAGGFYAWIEPDSITAEALRLGQDQEVLRIAAAASKYQLLAPSELAPLLERLTAGMDKDSRHDARQLVRMGVVASGA